jgi:hypothetical protein
MSQSYFDKRNQSHSFFILSPNYLAIIIIRCLRTTLFICLNSTYFLLCIYLKIKLRFFSLIVLRNSCAKPSNLFPSPQFNILLFLIIILLLFFPILFYFWLNNINFLFIFLLQFRTL